jgi:RHH-type transcriptional regulator, rel operon repressor / antitoxin RelB
VNIPVHRRTRVSVTQLILRSLHGSPHFIVRVAAICVPLCPAEVMLYLYSEVSMLAIRLPQSIEKRLEKLARRTGRTKTYYVREAILEHLEDLEDLYLAERALERIRSGEEHTIPLKDAMKRHGLQR